MIEPNPRPEKITRYFESIYPSFALLAGMQLDIFTNLQNGPMRIENLAQVCGVRLYKLRPLLFILVQAGLLVYEDELFSNSAEANAYLVKGKSAYLGKRLGLTASNWQRMLWTAETFRAGKPRVNYDDPSLPEEMIELFQGLYHGAVADAKFLMEQYNFSDCESLLDVGGGSGGLGITIAKAHPNLRAIIADLPSVTPYTKKFVEDTNTSDQIEIIAANAVKDSLPEAYDVVVARQIIQVLSPEDAQALLKNMARVVKPGGKLFILGHVLDDSRQTPTQAVNFNLVLVTSSEFGEAYTDQEYRTWLQNAGFVGYTRLSMANGSSFISVTKSN